MLTLFDTMVLVGIILIVVIWLYRHLRGVLKSNCDSAGCANCSGCPKGKPSD